jgi:hypothetical protein
MHLAGEFGEVAVRKLATAGRMHDETILRMAFGDRNAPGLGRSPFEHLPCGGARHPHRPKELPGAARAVAVLVAVLGSPSAWTTLTRLQSASSSSASTMGKIGLDAGAHLGAACDNRHDARLGDPKKGVGRKIQCFSGFSEG